MKHNISNQYNKEKQHKHNISDHVLDYLGKNTTLLQQDLRNKNFYS